MWDFCLLNQGSLIFSIIQMEFKKVIMDSFKADFEVQSRE